MRVRVLKDFATANRTFHAGEVTDIDPKKAEGWLRAGLVMQDKSLDGARETKGAEHGDAPEPGYGDGPPPAPVKSRRKSKKRIK